MLAILLGLGAALAYGLSDFLGGLLSRRRHYALIALIGNGTAFVVTVVALAVSIAVEWTAPTVEAVLWGLASGIGGGIGTIALYRGLGRGRMGIVAPLSAVGAAALPVLIGVAIGDRPSLLAWTGVLLAMPAIWLVSTADAPAGGAPPGEAPAADPTLRGRMSVALHAGVGDGLLAGLGFALLFIGLGVAGEGSGLWPVVASQMSAVTLIVILTAGTLRRLGRPAQARRDIGLAMVVGILGAVASVSYFWSTHAGMLSIVAVLTSLYPAVTVLLAATLLRERIGRRQAIGLVLAAAAVLVIVLG